MKLKLAEYKNGKFERFLELGKDFVFGEKFIGVYPQSAWQAVKKSTIFSTDNFYKFYKDEKDPLNRFDGLFDGRTYGKGRFVLIESKIIDRFGKKVTMIQDDIFRYNEFYQKACDFVNFHYWQETENELETNPDFRILGNLHENPELFSQGYYKMEVS